MDSVNELALRNILLKRPTAGDLLRHILKSLLNDKKSWEEKRAMWHFLFRWGKEGTLVHALVESLNSKEKVPFDLLIELSQGARARPKTVVIEALLKGVRKQRAAEDLIAQRSWDKWDKRFVQIRNDLMEKLVAETHQARGNMLDKFRFLLAQRMQEQAGRVLRRMLGLFPGDEELKEIKVKFDEDWARGVLNTHMSDLAAQAKDAAPPTKSHPAEVAVLKKMFSAAQKHCRNSPESASDLAMTFLFMQDYEHALKCLALATPALANEWLRVDLLMLARRFVEAMDIINQLEARHSYDPETSFAASYLRAQCYKELGQREAALEILQSIVRVRPTYRSAQAFILEWSQGVTWE